MNTDSKNSTAWKPPIPIAHGDLPEFPVDALSPWIRDYVHALATSTQTPTDLAAMLAMSAVAITCARRIDVRIKPDYREPLNIYTMTAMPPGSRKSAVFTHVMRPIVAAEQRLVGAADDNNGCTPRLMTDDASPAALATLLAEQRERIAVVSAEGGVFRRIADRQSPISLELYLKGHVGDSLCLDRKNRKPEYVVRPSLTIALAVQPEVIRSLARTPSFGGRGLLGRFFYALPPSLIGFRVIDAPPVPTSVFSAYQVGMEALLSDLLSPEEHTLCLSERAKARWARFFDEIERRQRPEGDLFTMTDWASKGAGGVARVAGLLHLADRPGDAAAYNAPIEGDVMERAVQVGEYLIPHAKAAYAMMACDPVRDGAQHVLAWIRRSGLRAFSRREAQKANEGRFRRVDQLKLILGLLQEHNYIRELTQPRPRKAGRPPSPQYRVHPSVIEPLDTIDTKDNTDSSVDCVDCVDGGASAHLGDSAPHDYPAMLDLIRGTRARLETVARRATQRTTRGRLSKWWPRKEWHAAVLPVLARCCAIHVVEDRFGPPLAYGLKACTAAANQLSSDLSAFSDLELHDLVANAVDQDEREDPVRAAALSKLRARAQAKALRVEAST